MESIQHKLQQFDPGIVWLDADNRILAMNGVAIDTLGDSTGKLIGEEVLQLHPEKSQDKVKFLLDQSSCPVDSPPPMTMMINIPDRVLLIKVSKMCNQTGPVGTCMIFYDLTDLATVPDATDSDAGHGAIKEGPRQLFKLPVYKNHQILLIDLDSVACIKAEGHYSTLYAADDETYLFNLSLSDLEALIASRHYVRVHRSHIVNMQYAKAFEKENEQCYLIVDHKDGLRVPISRSNVSKLKQLLGLA